MNQEPEYNIVEIALKTMGRGSLEKIAAKALAEEARSIVQSASKHKELEEVVGMVCEKMQRHMTTDESLAYQAAIHNDIDIDCRKVLLVRTRNARTIGEITDLYTEINSREKNTHKARKSEGRRVY
jgi:hypothetical protein